MAQGIRGPKPKPAHLKALEGRQRSKIPKHEPIPPGGPPDPPSFLDAYAREEWDRLAPGLVTLGLLSVLDAGSFAAYCKAYSLWRHAEESLARQIKKAEKAGADNPQDAGMAQFTKNGNIIQHTLLGVANKAAADMVRYAAEFGLTPSARARLGIDLEKQRKGKFSGLIGMDGGKK